MSLPGPFTPAAMLAIAFAACDLPSEQVRPEGPRGIEEVTTGAARTALTDGGTFSLAPPKAPPGLEIISPERATELALYEARMLAPMRPMLQEVHGKPIDFMALVAGPAYYAESPINISDRSLPGPLRKIHGPYYVVPLYIGTEQVMVSAVSALNTDVEIRDGQLYFPRHHGGEFLSFSVPAGMKEAFVSPETAAAVVSATGAKVVAAPRLVLQARPVSPTDPVWQLELDRTIQLALAGGRTHAAQTLYVGPGGQIYIPAEEQEASITRIWREPKRKPSDASVIRTIHLPRRSEMNGQFLKASLQR